MEKRVSPCLNVGQDDWSVAKKLARKKNYDISNAIWLNKCFHVGVKDVYELITGYLRYSPIIGQQSGKK
jgi:hypothetical protein